MHQAEEKLKDVAKKRDQQRAVELEGQRAALLSRCWLVARNNKRRCLVQRRTTTRRYLVDPASSHMLVSKIKPCMSKYTPLHGETANGSLNQL